MVGALLEIWGCHYDKTREPPWRAMEMRTPFGGCVSGQFTTMFSMIYVIEGKSRNVRLLSQKGAGRSPEDRSLQSKGAAVGGDLRKRHLRPRWGLGFLRGALIQSQNQIS